MTLVAFFGCKSFSKFAPEKYFARGDELKFATAIYNSDSRTVRQMIADNIVDLNASGEKGFSYLMYAVYIEQYDVAKVLLENGADPLYVSKDGRSLAFIVQNSIEKKLGTPKSLAHAKQL